MPGEPGADHRQPATAEELEEELGEVLPTVDNDDDLDEVSGDLSSDLAWLTSLPENGTKQVSLPSLLLFSHSVACSYTPAGLHSLVSRDPNILPGGSPGCCSCSHRDVEVFALCRSGHL